MISVLDRKRLSLHLVHCTIWLLSTQPVHKQYTASTQRRLLYRRPCGTPPWNFPSALRRDCNSLVSVPDPHVTPARKTEKARSGSRVLTSAENLSLMREKEKRKKEVADEKQR